MAGKRLVDRVATTLTALATTPHVLVALAIFAVYIATVMVPAYHRIKTYSGGVGPIDLLITYSPEDAYDKIAAYGQRGRQYYAVITLTLDVILSVASAGVFSLTLAHIFDRAFSRDDLLRRALLIPPAAMAADLLENISIAAMLLSYPREPPAVALLASAFSTVKWTAVSAQVALVIVGLAVCLIKKGPWRSEKI